MRILMINKFLYRNGGSETYTFKLGNFLEEKGHQVQYFGMDNPKRCVSNNVNSYTSDMDFHDASALKKLTYSLRTIYSSEARKKIRKILEDFKPDVCHLNNFNYQLTPSIILEIRKWEKQSGNRCKIIYTAHDYQLVCPNHMCNNPVTRKNCEKCLEGKFINCLKGKCIHGSTAKSAIGMMEAYFWKMKKVYKQLDKIICCSNFMKTKLDTNPVLASRTVAMHNFVDKVEKKDCKKENYVIYFGRYSEEKGIDTLIQVCKELPEVKFVFAGTGPLEDKLSGVANITNVGFKTGKKLEDLIRKAKFSLCPSECNENCPLSVMESQMYGTPVIGSNRGGIPELILDGKTGELFESGNKDELKSRIYDLWVDEFKLQKFIVECMNVNYDNIDNYYEKLMQIYSGM